MNTLRVELDHVFVWVAPGAPESAALEGLGLRADPQVHRHAGQGTSSIVYVFENAYLELIWVDDEGVAGAKGREMGTDLPARAGWRETGASPFGVGLRRRAHVRGADLPFAAREYRADWMQPGTCIHIAESSADTGEPLIFVVPEYIAMPAAGPPTTTPAEATPDPPAYLAHPLGVKRLTRVKITAARPGGPSATASLLSENGVAEIAAGESPLSELEFDGGARGERHDARPALPIVLRR